MNDNKSKFPIGELAQSASPSSPIVDEIAEKKKNQKKSLIKMGAMGILTLILLIFSSLSWFTMNTQVESGGMSIKTAPLPFELKTSGSSGLYDGFLDEVATGYANTETTGGSQGIKWKLTKNVSEMNNVRTAGDTTDFADITKIDSDKYGLKPGDSGELVFSIVPNGTAELNISINVKITGYKAGFDNEGNKTSAALQKVTDETMVHYLNSHIILFYMGADNKKHLLTSDGFNVPVSEETPVTIYWVWPATLREILDANIEAINDTNASKEVRRLFFEHPDYFLKTTGSDSFESITVAANEDTDVQETAIADFLPSISGRNYNTYGSMYNDADQTIGDNFNYILVELVADLDND